MSVDSKGSGTLHLLLTADRSLWQDCVRHCQAADTVVLLDGAVMGLVWPENKILSEFTCPVLASKPDVEARIGTLPGISDTASRISDDEFVGLIETHKHCLSWR